MEVNISAQILVSVVLSAQIIDCSFLQLAQFNHSLMFSRILH